MKKLNLLLCLVLFWTLTGRANAAPGDLDQTFGPVGFVTTSLSTNSDRAFAAARQTDGKIVLAGARGFGSVAVVRYNADGTLDNSFGSGGSVVTFISSISEASAVAVQTDGKIVVAARGSTAGFVIIRYNSNGTPDTTFDGDGVFTDSTVGLPNALAIQPDGKIVTAGSIVGPNFFTNDFSIVRLNTNGTFDTSFDGDGKATVKVSDTNGGSSFAYALALQSDGKIVVAGEGDFSSTFRDFVLVRLNSDGSLDTTFDGDGKVNTAFGGNSLNEAARALVVQADGKIVAAGFGGENSVRGFALARYNSDGSLDTTFDGDGRVVTQTSVNGNEAANAVVVQPDGKIVAAGSSILQVALVRYNPNGTLDTTFDGDGKVYMTINPSGSAVARAVLLEPNGKIVIGGTASKSGVDEDFLLARYNADGTPSIDLGVFGYVVTNPFNQTDQSSQAVGVAVQTGGKIVVAANRIVSNSVTVGDILRYTPEGRLDSSFASTQFGSGIVSISFPGATQEITAVVAQRDGKILVCGSYENESEEDVGLFVVRFNNDGTRDTTFGSNGAVRLSAINSNGGLGQDLALQSDGKIIVGGAAPNFDTMAVEFAAFRFNENGTLDTTFGTNGVARTDLGAGDDFAFSVAVQPDNRIVLGGAANFSDNSIAAKLNRKINLQKFSGAKRGAVASGTAAFVKFNQNGTLDTMFGANGKLVTPIGSSANFVLDVQSQLDGKIVAVALTCLDCANAISTAILRFNANGSFDNSFDGDGIVNMQVPNSSGVYAPALDIQTNGKIVVAGLNANSSTLNDALVARYNSNGSPDATFGTNGIVTSDIGGTNQQANAVVVQPGGKIITAGSTTNGARTDIAVWRYIGDGNLIDYSPPLFDFDGDGRADISVFRPSNGIWYIQQSSGGFRDLQFGQSGDKLAPADYDGDGKTDIAVFRSGIWYLQRSTSGFTTVNFGISEDIPVPADFDGDGNDDIAVFRPSNGIWYIQQSRLGLTGIQFGQTGDSPAAADYDGDGKADIAVFRPSNGIWYVNRSTAGFTSVQFGQANDKIVPADYDGDGKTDIAVFRPSNGTWYLNRSTAGFTSVQFGISTDLPAPTDYDGDGKADIAVFRPSNGIWYLNRSTEGLTAFQFGAANDKPIPNAFVQ